MANENEDKKKSINNYNSSEKKAPDKIIDVTKPRASNYTSPITNISDFTLKEQEALEKIKTQMGKKAEKRDSNKLSNFKTVIAVVLVVILVAIAIAFVVIIGKNTDSEEENYDTRISMKIENKSALTIITDTGKEELREINPGDKIPLSAYIRNSNEYTGDGHGGGATPPNIYVRFKIVLILGFEERYDIIVPTMTELWYKYNAEDESNIIDGATEDDHYYYYLGSLSFLQKAELFSSIEFNGETITCDDGGKYGQIQVQVEAIEANINNITSEGVWPTAPKKWVMEMARLVNNA